MKRLLVVGMLPLVAVAVIAVLAGGGAAAPSSDPGVTSNQVLIGGTAPLTGEAASGGLTAFGANAYFQWVNAHGGVKGRKIRYKIYDDGYDPARTVQDTRQLVLQDHVFAVFNSVGTAQNIAVRPYLNQLKVPQLFVASGWSGWGRDYRKYPFTMGFIPTYAAEGKIYARHILATRKNAKIAVLYQNDEYGKELLSGLRAGLGKRSRQVVAARGYDPSEPSVQSEVTSLRSSNANTFMIFAFGTRAIQAFVTVKKLGWKPQIYVNAVAAATSTMRIASSTGQTEGAISIGFFKDPANPRWAKDKGYRLYRSIMKRYLPGKTVSNGYYMAGMAAAYAMTQALRSAGRNLTRGGLMRAVTRLNLKDPFSFPGIRVKTTPTDRYPIQQAQLGRWHNGRWHYFGKILSAR
jgi:branched-chain amino acid transport system substrate-binding protein